MRTTKILIRRRGCAGLFKSSLGHMSEGTFSHVAAQIITQPAGRDNILDSFS